MTLYNFNLDLCLMKCYVLTAASFYQQAKSGGVTILKVVLSVIFRHKDANFVYLDSTIHCYNLSEIWTVAQVRVWMCFCSQSLLTTARSGIIWVLGTVFRVSHLKQPYQCPFTILPGKEGKNTGHLTKHRGLWYDMLLKIQNQNQIQFLFFCS